ncbi:MAG: amylo-alpha-1,6-glucosidase [Algisphaera sp.]
MTASDPTPLILTAAQTGRAALQEAEWLLTNGTGSFAMGTALGCNTRRYHGLLVAAATPPVGRVVVLNQVADELILHGTQGQADQKIALSSFLFRSGEDAKLIHSPAGYAALERCERDQTIRWVYTRGPIRVVRELTLHDAAPAATLRWYATGLPGPATLRVSPLVTLRDFHTLETGLDANAFHLEAGPSNAQVTRGDHTAAFTAPGGTFEAKPDMWHRAVYPCETFRGQDDTEDLFAPGCFTFDLDAGAGSATLAVRRVGPLQPATVAAPRLVRDHAMATRLTAAGVPDAMVLARAASDFVVSRTRGGQQLSTVIAGYPWFADWGRDTFIALPGLMLATGRIAQAGHTLKAFAQAMRDGLVPNRFDDYDETLAHYNTVDGSLWFVHAALAYAQACGQSEPWLIDAVRAVVDAHLMGTHAQGHDDRAIPIGVDDDGLIVAGDDHTQLTWMDAACDGQVFTPRPGRCVEINALWYSALTGLAAALTPSDPSAAGLYAATARRVHDAFNATFCGGPHGGLIDHVRPDGTADTALRPNQIIACALERSPLSLDDRAAGVAAVRDHLLTPVGLRTLPTDDPAYHPHYRGNAMARDGAYHRGTLWPWLMGSYAEAVLRAGTFSDAARKEAHTALAGLHEHLNGRGFGQIHEIFEAKPGPNGVHAPRGCPAQAWSIAELIRANVLLNEKR